MFVKKYRADAPQAEISAAITNIREAALGLGELE